MSVYFKMLVEISNIISQISEDGLNLFAETLLKHKQDRIFIIGNGGSSLTAQHLASDLSNLGFDVQCLCENMARITAITNDYGWEEVYERQLNHILPDDIVVALSVHGGHSEWSNNLVRAVKYAKDRHAYTCALVGFDGGELAKLCDLSIVVPADRTYIVEGIHDVLTHAVCQKVADMGQIKCNK